MQRHNSRGEALLNHKRPIGKRDLSIGSELDRLIGGDYTRPQMREELHDLAGLSCFGSLNPEVLPGYPLALRVDRRGVETVYVLMREGESWSYNTHRPDQLH